MSIALIPLNDTKKGNIPQAWTQARNCKGFKCDPEFKLNLISNGKQQISLRLANELKINSVFTCVILFRRMTYSS